LESDPEPKNFMRWSRSWSQRRNLKFEFRLDSPDLIVYNIAGWKLSAVYVIKRTWTWN